MSSPERTEILFVHSSNEMYGSDRILLEVVRALPADVRPAVEVWLPNDSQASGRSLSDELINLNIRFRVIDLPVLRRRYMTLRHAPVLLRRLRHTRALLRASQPRAIYLVTSAMLPMSVILPRGTACILHCQELWSGLERVVLSIFALRARKILCISATVLERMPGLLRRRSILLENAVPSPQMTAAPASAPGNVVRYLVASRWLAWKGHGTLLRAWADAGAPGHLTILGGPPPLGAAVDVPDLVRRHPYPESIDVVGEVDDIGPYIDQAHVMVVPSDDPEPFGLVAIEAFARGRGVIASAAGGLGEIVEPDRTGALFPNTDAGALTQLFVSMTPERAAAWGHAGRSVYEERFSTEAFGRRLNAALAEASVIS